MRAVLALVLLPTLAHADHLGRYARVFVDDDPKHAAEGRGGGGGTLRAVIEIRADRGLVTATYTVGPVNSKTPDGYPLKDVKLEGDHFHAMTYAVPKAAIANYVPFALDGTFQDNTLTLTDHTTYAR